MRIQDLDPHVQQYIDDAILRILQTQGGLPNLTGMSLVSSTVQPVSLAGIGNTPNSQGMSLTNNVLNLQPADPTNPGVISAGAQTLGGTKTFQDGLSYLDLVPNPSLGVSAAGKIRSRNNAGRVQVSENGNAYKGIVPPSLNVLDFGADPTGVADSLAAFQAALAFTNVVGDTNQAGTIIVPPGTYKMSGTLFIDRRVNLQGFGGHTDQTTLLVFPANTIGLRCRMPAENTAGTSAAWSVISGLALQGSGLSDGVSHGIHATCNITIRDCYIYGFAGHGIYIYGNGAGIPATNADGSNVSHVSVYSCHGDGLRIQGYDGNACSVTNMYVVSCDGYGISDYSFLGNEYSHCVVQQCLGGGYFVDGAVNTSGFFSCYDECGNPNATGHGAGPYMFGGQTHGGFAPFDTINGGWHVLSSTRSIDMPVFYLKAQGDTAPSPRFSLTDNSRNAIFSIALPQDGPGDTTCLRNTGNAWGSLSNYGSNQWMTWASGGGQFGGSSIGMSYASILSGDSRFPSRYAGTGAPFFPALYVGSYGSGAANGRRITATPDFSNPALIYATWHLGDIALNATATNGNIEGWRCVDGGTSGTYTEGRTATTNGTTTVTLSGQSTVLHIGDRLIINGVTAYINNVDAAWPTVLTMSATIPAGAALPIAYAAPTFVTFGSVDGAHSTGNVVAGTTINSANCTRILLGSSAPTTMTATPTLTNGVVDGQELLVINNSANAITLQDDGTLAGSNLILGAANVVLAQYDRLRLVWVGGKWRKT